MKIIVLFAIVAATVAFEFYTTANDHLDMDALISNKAELQAFLDCFIDRKPCTELTASYKRIMPESIRESCRKCNTNQKHQFWRFLEGLKMQLPEEYKNFRHYYDPEDKYFDVLEKEISRYFKPDMDMFD